MDKYRFDGTGFQYTFSVLKNWKGNNSLLTFLLVSEQHAKKVTQGIQIYEAQYTRHETQSNKCAPGTCISAKYIQYGDRVL